MNDAEAAELLGHVAAFDRRTVGRADAAAWAAALHDVPLADAVDAVRAHFRESREWLLPNHVFARVAQVRRERLRAAGGEPAFDPSWSGVQYAAAVREWRRLVEAGTPADAAVRVAAAVSPVVRGELT